MLRIDSARRERVEYDPIGLGSLCRRLPSGLRPELFQSVTQGAQGDAEEPGGTGLVEHDRQTPRPLP